jgi:hypothetical protein
MRLHGSNSEASHRIVFGSKLHLRLATPEIPVAPWSHPVLLAILLATISVPSSADFGLTIRVFVKEVAALPDSASKGRALHRDRTCSSSSHRP